MSTRSSSKTETTTQQYDQRILAEEGSLVIGAGASASYINEFSDTVADAFNRLIDFASGAGEIAVKSYERSTDVLAEQLSTAKQPTQTFIIKALPYFVVVGLAIFGISILRAKK